jgi:hypothetical protein
MTMVRSVSFIFILAIVFIFWGNEGYGQCDVTFEYKVEQHDGNDYKISIKLEQIAEIGRVEFRLYDLYTGSFVDEETIDTTELKEFTGVFLGIRPSMYMIYISVDNCQYFLGQDKGIIVGRI